MSGTLTDYGREQLLGKWFITDVYTTTPAGLWVAYTHSIPVRNADVTQLDEPVDFGGAAVGAYARAPIGALTSASWAFSGFAEVYNTLDVVFPAAPTADWGLVLGWALLDEAALGAGNVVAVGPIVEPYIVSNGDAAPEIPSAGIVVGLYD